MHKADTICGGVDFLVGGYLLDLVGPQLVHDHGPGLGPHCYPSRGQAVGYLNEIKRWIDGWKNEGMNE